MAHVGSRMMPLAELVDHLLMKRRQVVGLRLVTSPLSTTTSYSTQLVVRSPQRIPDACVAVHTVTKHRSLQQIP
jgi:hypothetical protein